MSVSFSGVRVGCLLVESTLFFIKRKRATRPIAIKIPVPTIQSTLIEWMMTSSGIKARLLNALSLVEVIGSAGTAVFTLGQRFASEGPCVTSGQR